MTIAAARAEIVTKLKTIGPIQGRSYEYAPDSLQPPCAFVGAMSYNPRASLGAVSDLTVQIWVAVGGASSAERAVKALDAYVDQDGDYSVIDALVGAGTAWDDLDVVEVEYPVNITVGAGEYVCARFDCELFL